MMKVTIRKEGGEQDVQQVDADKYRLYGNEVAFFKDKKEVKRLPIDGILNINVLAGTVTPTRSERGSPPPVKLEED